MAKYEPNGGVTYPPWVGYVLLTLLAAWIVWQILRVTGQVVAVYVKRGDSPVSTCTCGCVCVCVRARARVCVLMLVRVNRVDSGNEETVRGCACRRRVPSDTNVHAHAQEHTVHT